MAAALAQHLSGGREGHEDWDVSDLADQPIEVVRAIRDDLEARVTALLSELLPTT